MPTQTKEAGKTFWQAFLEMQKELPTLSKDAKNDYYKTGGQAHKYVPLEQVVETARPILHAHGFVYSQPVTSTESGGSSLTTILIYTKTGEEVSYTMPLMITPDKHGHITSQGQGSAITYARRYQLMSVLGVVGEEDDDANRATKEQKEKQKAADQVVPTQRTTEIYMMLATAGFDPDEYEKLLKKPIKELTNAEADEVTAKLGAYINRERAKKAAMQRAEAEGAQVPEMA